MTALVICSALLVWGGATLIISETRWGSRRSLGDRLELYGFEHHGAGRRQVQQGGSMRAMVHPQVHLLAEHLARALGIDESVSARLDRVSSPVDATRFRARQLRWTAAGSGAGLLLAAVARAPLPLVAILGLSGGLLAFLLLEHQLSRQVASWRQALLLELPVVAEHLAMLLSAGYSLGASLNRLAERGAGVCAHDLARVCLRIRQGCSEREALREWGARARVAALDRLVAVLVLGHETPDLGRLVADEARSIRRDVHRILVETMEKRSQQVWVPVTVAALVPGVIFLMVPFLQALRSFAGP